MDLAADPIIRTALQRPADSLVELDRIDARASLAAFIRMAWPQIEPGSTYVHNWHIDAIAEHLEAVSDGRITRLLINVPPGAGKSLITSVFWPAWEWGPRGHPEMRVLATTYSETLAMRDNERTRNLIVSEWYQRRWPVQLLKEGAKKIEKAQFGFREARPFVSLMGARGDRLVIDDPHSTETAESQLERERTIRVFVESVPTRLNNIKKSAIVIIMQRLHEEDVSGVALAKELGYEHLMIPMEFDPARRCTTSIGWSDPRTEEGELMFPARFPRQVVEDLKRGMGKFAVAGQFQQSPAPRGGAIFARLQWKHWPPEGEVLDQWGQPLSPLNFPPMSYVVASVDTAMATASINDWSACTVWGVWAAAEPVQKIMVGNRLAMDPGNAGMLLAHSKLMLMDGWHDRLELYQLVQKIIATCRKHKVDRLLVEAKANGLSVVQEIRRLCANEPWAVTPVTVNIDKVARAYAVQPMLEQGLIYAPDRRWADLVIDEMASFPRGAHDDLTDTATAAWRHLRDSGALTLAHERDRDYARALTPKRREPVYDV